MNKKEYYKKWAKNNREKLRKYLSEWRKKHPENVKKHQSKTNQIPWEQKKKIWKSHSNEYAREYQKNRYLKLKLENNLKERIYKYDYYKEHIKYARRKGVSGKFTKEELNELYKKQNNQCLFCFKYEPEIKLTIDHIVPISKGGTGYISNIQLLCRSCNSSKGVKLINSPKNREFTSIAK